jgi:hypothetical protein
MPEQDPGFSLPISLYLIKELVIGEPVILNRSFPRETGLIAKKPFILLNGSPKPGIQ